MKTSTTPNLLRLLFLSLTASRVLGELCDGAVEAVKEIVDAAEDDIKSGIAASDCPEAGGFTNFKSFAYSSTPVSLDGVLNNLAPGQALPIPMDIPILPEEGFGACIVYHSYTMDDDAGNTNEGIAAYVYVDLALLLPVRLPFQKFTAMRVGTIDDSCDEVIKCLVKRGGGPFGRHLRKKSSDRDLLLDDLSAARKLLPSDLSSMRKLLPSDLSSMRKLAGTTVLDMISNLPGFDGLSQDAQFAILIIGLFADFVAMDLIPAEEGGGVVIYSFMLDGLSGMAESIVGREVPFDFNPNIPDGEEFVTRFMIGNNGNPIQKLVISDTETPGTCYVNRRLLALP